MGIILPDAYDLIKLDSVDSTNLLAQKYIEEGRVEGPLVIVADEQTHGRGRYDRQWVSTKGNLYCSIVLKVNRPIVQLSQLSFVVALAVAEAIGEEQKVSVKWPNDILVDGKKVAGILVQSFNIAKNRADIVIGIGCNIISYPEKTDFPATSLKKEKMAVSRDALVEKIVTALEKHYSIWLSGFVGIKQLWLTKCAHLDKEIVVKGKNYQQKGIFRGISEIGELLLECDDGNKIENITIGDVFFED